jgi:SAM-dependent methyltransferase
VTKVMIGAAAKERRNYVLNLGKPAGKILEIGAFDNAIFHRGLEDDVKYLDWFSKAELCEMHKNNPRRHLERAVEVDFVVKTSFFANEVAERFDLICASEVIEHIADVISWLNQLESLLTEQGRVFLVVPDRRYTFDYFRSVSEAVEMVRAYREKLTRPDVWQLASHFYYHFKVDPKELWEGKRPKKFVPRFDFATALKMAEEKSKTYTDAHCWVFTAGSFVRIIDDLRGGGFINLRISHLRPPVKGSNSFLAVLEKQS